MPTFEPRDPNFEARCRDELARQGLMGLIGAEIVRIEPGFCELHLPYRRELTQQHGYYHAGMVSTLADNAGGYAAASLVPADTEVLAVEFKINFLAPAKGECLIARGRVLKPGRTLIVCAVDVFIRTDGQEKLCAAMQQTVMGLAGYGDRK